MSSRKPVWSSNTRTTAAGRNPRSPTSPTLPDATRQVGRGPVPKLVPEDGAKARKVSDDSSSSVRSSSSSIDNTELHISEDKVTAPKKKTFQNIESKQKVTDSEDKSSAFLIKKRNSLRKTDGPERSNIPRKSNSFRTEDLSTGEKFRTAAQLRKTSIESDSQSAVSCPRKPSVGAQPKTETQTVTSQLRKTSLKNGVKERSKATPVSSDSNLTKHHSNSVTSDKISKTARIDSSNAVVKDEKNSDLSKTVVDSSKESANENKFHEAVKEFKTHEPKDITNGSKAVMSSAEIISQSKSHEPEEIVNESKAHKVVEIANEARIVSEGFDSARQAVNGERKSDNPTVSHASSNVIDSKSVDFQRSTMNDQSSDLPSPIEATGIHLCLHDRPKIFTQFTCPEQPGYVGFANLPNQVHRKSVKKGFEFTLMVVGESGLGKSTLVNSLFLTDLYPERIIHSAAEKIKQTVKIDASTVEIEERGVKLRLTVVDTPGFGDSLNSVDCFKPIIQYVDDQFERYLQDESGLNRRHIVDNRVHCCFYFINPSGHGLRPLDVTFMKAVHHKVNIVPVIAKSDTLTKHEVQRLKKRILDQINEYGISIYPLPDCDTDEDEDYREQCKQLKEAVPFAVIGANTVIEVKGRKVRGRMYPWGVVEVENPDHCDFIKLRTMLITHMQDLQEVTQEVHYENFRADKLASGGAMKKVRRQKEEVVEDKNRRPESIVGDDKEKQLAEKDAELRKMQEMLSRMQAEMEAQKRMAGTPGKQNGGIKSENV